MNKNKIRSIKTAAKGYAFIGINLIGVLIFWTIYSGSVVKTKI